MFYLVFKEVQTIPVKHLKKLNKPAEHLVLLYYPNTRIILILLSR